MTSVQSPAHRFKIGEEVALARGFGYVGAGAHYEVTALLPAARTHFQYRIRSKAEAFSRVASENELRPREASNGVINAKG
jgi:hypothetical protein